MYQGLEALYTVSSLVDVDRGQVLLDLPLGINDDPVSRAFSGWWLPPSGSEGARSPGLAVAEAMKLVVDVTAANASEASRAVATMVERTHPIVAPRTADDAKELLAEALIGAASL